MSASTDSMVKLERQVSRLQIERREGEGFEQLLKRFRSSITRSGVISEYKRHQVFVSRAERTRARMRRAVRKQHKLMRRAA